MLIDSTPDTPFAPRWRRLFALFYELLLLAALLLTASALFLPIFAHFGHSGLSDTGFKLYLLAVLYGYFSWCWRKSGQTVAMKTWRLRVEQQQGGLLNHQVALIRFGINLMLLVGIPTIAFLGWRYHGFSIKEAIGLASMWCLVPWGWAWLDKDQLFLQDRLSKTKVVLLPLGAKPSKKEESI